MNIADRVRPLATRILASRGLDLFDVEFRREPGGMVLRVRIDCRGTETRAEESVSVDDCAKVSRDLSAVLDVEAVVPGAYVLEVSSPGLDRPLRDAADYRRFAGRRAKVIMREPVDGQSFFKGRLGGVEGHDILLDTDDGRRHRVPLGIITRAHLEVEF